MGTVYRAVRDDDEFRKDVAIKVVKRGMDTDAMLDRFRHERQILANLDHPCIARLLDGGSVGGQPFFVMELVEGVPVDEYCRVNRLSIDAICALFLKVCEGVEHAHHNLVVHRDLKPSNILVTAAGVPKLLDFGVAKLLHAAPEPNATLTHIAMRPMTPEYASPEQFRGGEVVQAPEVMERINETPDPGASRYLLLRDLVRARLGVPGHWGWRPSSTIEGAAPNEVLAAVEGIPAEGLR